MSDDVKVEIKANPEAAKKAGERDGKEYAEAFAKAQARADAKILSIRQKTAEKLRKIETDLRDKQIKEEIAETKKNESRQQAALKREISAHEQLTRVIKAAFGEAEKQRQREVDHVQKMGRLQAQAIKDNERFQAQAQKRQEQDQKRRERSVSGNLGAAIFAGARYYQSRGISPPPASFGGTPSQWVSFVRNGSGLGAGIAAGARFYTQNDVRPPPAQFQGTPQGWVDLANKQRAAQSDFATSLTTNKGIDRARYEERMATLRRRGDIAKKAVLGGGAIGALLGAAGLNEVLGAYEDVKTLRRTFGEGAGALSVRQQIGEMSHAPSASANLGFTKMETAAMASGIAGMAGRAPGRTLQAQQAMRATGATAGEVGGLFALGRRAGDDPLRAFATAMRAGVKAGLDDGRLPQFIRPLTAIAEAMLGTRARAAGTMDAAANMSTMFGRQGFHGVLGAQHALTTAQGIAANAASPDVMLAMGLRDEGPVSARRRAQRMSQGTTDAYLNYLRRTYGTNDRESAVQLLSAKNGLSDEVNEALLFGGGAHGSGGPSGAFDVARRAAVNTAGGGMFSPALEARHKNVRTSLGMKKGLARMGDKLRTGKKYLGKIVGNFVAAGGRALSGETYVAPMATGDESPAELVGRFQHQFEDNGSEYVELRDQLSSFRMPDSKAPAMIRDAMLAARKELRERLNTASIRRNAGALGVLLGGKKNLNPRQKQALDAAQWYSSGADGNVSAADDKSLVEELQKHRAAIEKLIRVHERQLGR